MRSYLARRLLSSVVTLFVIATAAFAIVRLAPGDPAEIWLADYATPQLIETVRREMGLDKPIPVQYIIFLGSIARGDLGRSFRTHRAITEDLAHFYPYTVKLAIAGLVVAGLIGMPVGVISALKKGSWVDTAVMAATLSFVAAPGFWLGLMLLLVFSYYLGWLPMTGAGDPRNWIETICHLILPALAIGTRGAAVVARMSRSAVIEVLGEDYIRTARSKGLAERVVVYRHALRNALGPILSVLGMETVIFLGGAVVAETVFSRPGIGRLLVFSIQCRDYPAVQGTLFMFATMVILINLATDIMYAVVDPRVRLR